MKNVTAAVILRGSDVFIARRAPRENMAGGWEFPGGKIEENETPEECLKRELFEEFGVDSRIGTFFAESVYDYPMSSIRLMAYFAEIIQGDICLKVHDDFRWVKANELMNFDLLPADVPIAEKLADILSDSGFSDL